MVQHWSYTGVSPSYFQIANALTTQGLSTLEGLPVTELASS